MIKFLAYYLLMRIDILELTDCKKMSGNLDDGPSRSFGYLG